MGSQGALELSIALSSIIFYGVVYLLEVSVAYI